MVLEFENLYGYITKHQFRCW